MAWQALTASLIDVSDLSSEDRQDPAILADRIREAILASEGTGIADLSGRLISLHDQLLALDKDSREVAARKLASLIERLLPELRGSLLVVRSNDEPKWSSSTTCSTISPCRSCITSSKTSGWSAYPFRRRSIGS
jgi:hypothetical protein